MSNVNNIIEQFTYFWEIKNLQYSTLQTGQFIDSPVFCVPQFMNTRYYIRLYPHGFSGEFKNNTSCFMYRGDDSGPDSVEIEFGISISSTDQYKYFSSKERFLKNKPRGYSLFLPNNLNHYGKSVVVTWEMHFRQLCSLSDMYNLKSFISFDLENNLSFTEAVEELISEETHASTKKGLSFPVKCFAQTEILYDTKSIQRFIDSLVSGTCTETTIPLILPQKFPSIIINLKGESVYTLSIYISLKDKAFKKPFIVICEMSITNCVEQLLYSFEGKHIFTAGKDENWCFIEEIDISRFLIHLSEFSSDKINLKIDFAFSCGETFSEILSMAHIKVPRKCVPDNKYIASNEIFRLYKENKFCDVTLKVGNKTFDVHKVVLGAASPVFDAMFTNEMTENKTSVVNIDDLDEKTVEEMVTFMYTGSVEELEYENAKKIFIAGDKYQILPLVNLCRLVMINHINSDTIYETLSIADKHNDSELEKKAVKFITENSILSSSEWTSFEKENTHFAVKILRQVCLLNNKSTILS